MTAARDVAPLDGFADEANLDTGQSWDEGRPTISHFANAIQVWAYLQGRGVTVLEAAMTFNAKPEVVRAAVEYHAWMFLDGDSIEHEGE